MTLFEVVARLSKIHMALAHDLSDLRKETYPTGSDEDPNQPLYDLIDTVRKAEDQAIALIFESLRANPPRPKRR
jgi:hypothetical protein